jgi:hypothetical protein
MERGFKALVIALVMALAAVPAAFAEKGGHGGGHGKPSWAGQGKPSWAGTGHAYGQAHHEQHEQKAKKPKHHEADAGAEDDSADEADLEGLNPAKYCKTLRDEVTKLERDFAAMFGTNPNLANAFGKCVSRRAHGEDLSDAAGGGDQQGEDNPCEASGTPTSEDAGTESEGSDDEASGPEECESDDSGSGEPADDEQSQGDDEQGEDDQGQAEDEAPGELDSSDLARALRFLRL